MPDNQLDQTIAFHGHYCPGLMIGYRAALIGLRELGIERAEDEELVAIIDTHACGVDAVQFLTGCTMGKGNLILRDWGKQVFTFGRRRDGRMVRIALRFGATDQEGDQELANDARRALMRERLRTWPEEQLFDVRWVDAPLPDKAQIHQTVQCAACGEGVMEARVHLRDGQPICPQCYGDK